MGDTMAEKSGAVNPTIPVTIKPQGQDAVPGDYHTYSGVDSIADGNTYGSRSSKLEEALGNKDVVKG